MARVGGRGQGESAPASGIDPALPAIALDDWLRGEVGLRGAIAANAPGFYGGTVIDARGRHAPVSSLSQLPEAVASGR